MFASCRVLLKKKHQMCSGCAASACQHLLSHLTSFHTWCSITTRVQHLLPHLTSSHMWCSISIKAQHLFHLTLPHTRCSITMKAQHLPPYFTSHVVLQHHQWLGSSSQPPLLLSLQKPSNTSLPTNDHHTCSIRRGHFWDVAHSWNAMMSSGITETIFHLV